MHKDIKSYEEAVAFHGHACPGLAIGYRASVIALEKLYSGRSEDEELICIVENDACSVDGVQFVAGCTLGKGNLLFRDYGKQTYTFILRDGSNAVRLSLKPDVSLNTDPHAATLMKKVFSGEANEEEMDVFQNEREKSIDRYLNLPADEVFEIRHVKPKIPEKARIFNSVTCERCGEMVSESRARIQNGRIVCIPCYDEYHGIKR